MQAHARVCKENKKELQEKMMPIEIILWKRCELEGPYRKSGGRIKMIFSRMICYNACVSRVWHSHGNEHQNLQTGWFLRMVAAI